MNSAEEDSRGSVRERSVPVSPTLYDETYFLDECEGHEEFITSEGRLLSRRLSTALAIADVQPGMKVLDIGCGRGESLVRLSFQGAVVWGLDYSSEALRIAERMIATNIGKERRGCLLVSANARHLPFPARSFDRVLMLDIVEHLHPWELDVALREVHRTLKPTGKLIVHTAPNRWYYRFGYPLFRLFQHLRGVGLPRNPRNRFRCHRYVHVSEQSPVSLWRNFRSTGFQSRLWVDDIQRRWQDEGRLGRLAGRMVTHLYPFKWVFCGDIFAVAWRLGKGHYHR